MKKVIIAIFVYYIVAIILLHLLDWCSIGCDRCGYRGPFTKFCPHCGYEVIEDE